MNEFCVLLSVYANEKPDYLESALHSIWHEQKLKPNQIVLVKDGPVCQGIEDVISEFQASITCEFTIVELKYNIGLAGALNKGLESCKYDIVARMDTDDISLPDRFSSQICYLKSKPNVSVLSGQVVEYCISMRSVLGKRSVPIDNASISLMSKTRNPISHPAVMFRKQHVLKVGGYPLLKNSQDWALWSLMISKGYEMGNLPHELLWMRTDKELLNRRNHKYYLNEIKLFKYQKNIGHIGWAHLGFNIVTKGFLRLSPNYVKSYLYRKFR